MAVRPIDAKALARRIREHMDDFLNATTDILANRLEEVLKDGKGD